MTNKEAANILKKCLSSEFKIKDLCAECLLTNAFQCACKVLLKEKVNDTCGDGFLVRHNLRTIYRLILEEYVFGDYDISKLYCFLQPETTEEYKEKYAKDLLITAMESACAVLSNSDD